MLIKAQASVIQVSRVKAVRLKLQIIRMFILLPALIRASIKFHLKSASVVLVSQKVSQSLASTIIKDTF